MGAPIRRPELLALHMKQASPRRSFQWGAAAGSAVRVFPWAVAGVSALLLLYGWISGEIAF